MNHVVAHANTVQSVTRRTLESHARLYLKGCKLKVRVGFQKSSVIVTEPRAVATGLSPGAHFFNDQRAGRYRSRFCNVWRTPGSNCTLSEKRGRYELRARKPIESAKLHLNQVYRP